MSKKKENPLRAEKRRKLGELRKEGIDPYPHTYDQKHHALDIKQDFDSKLAAGDTLEKEKRTVAGRVKTFRKMGKAAFMHIEDQTGQIQIYIRRDDLLTEDKVQYRLTDIGDIVGVTGFVFKTGKGELSLHAEKYDILCKTLEPLPEKYHGLTDVEQKYRYRHLDLIMDPDSRKVFEARSKIVREVRNFLDDRGFLEVEVPALQPIYGGAAAHPFETHHRALDMKLYMKISPELYLKRLIVGGFEKVYDMSKNFRNEGIDRSHNPEFTMLEWYEAYTDYEYQMKQFEDLFAHVAKKVTGSTKVMYQGTELDFTAPWKRMTMYEAIKEYGGVDVEHMSEADLFDTIKKWGSDTEKPKSKGEMVLEAFELKAEEHLIQPTFIIDHPIEVSPLTKTHREHSSLVERFEPFIAGMEVGNAYTELNDPEEQLARLKEQEKKRVIDEEAHPMDEDFMHAIDVGMPPTGGVGVGIERLVMLLTDRPSIRDIILFPTMRPQQ